MQPSRETPALPAALRPLQTALDLAERERDRALDALRCAEAADNAARRQDEVLAQYAREIDQRWGARAGLAGSPALLVHTHAFGHRIDQAREQQQVQCRQTGARAERAREHWRACEQRLAAVHRLLQRRLQALAAEASRRSRRQSDEDAARVARAAHERRAADTVM